MQASDFRGKGSELRVKREGVRAMPLKPGGVSVQGFNFGAAKTPFDQIGEPTSAETKLKGEVMRRARKVDIRLPGKGNSNSHGARPVHLIITMIKWIRTSKLSIKNSLSGCAQRTWYSV